MHFLCIYIYTCLCIYIYIYIFVIYSLSGLVGVCEKVVLNLVVYLVVVCTSAVAKHLFTYEDGMLQEVKYCQM